MRHVRHIDVVKIAIVLMALIQLTCVSSVDTAEQVQQAMERLEENLGTQALRLIEIEAQLDQAKAEGRQSHDAHEARELFAALSQGLSEIASSLARIQEELDDRTMCEEVSSDWMELEGLLETLDARRAAIEEDLSVLSNEAGPSSNQPDDSASLDRGRLELVTIAIDEVALIAHRISDSIRDAFLDVASVGQDLLVSLNSIDSGQETSASRTSVLPLALVTLITIVVTTIAMQNYYAGGFTYRRINDALRPKALQQAPTSEEEVLTGMSQPFWDLAADATDVASRRRASEADEEYVRMLFRLGYVEEARSMICDLEGGRPRHARTPTPIRDRWESEALYERQDVGVRQRGQGAKRAGVDVLKSAPDKVRNAFVTLANRSVERRMRARRLKRERKRRALERP